MVTDADNHEKHSWQWFRNNKLPSKITFPSSRAVWCWHNYGQMFSTGSATTRLLRKQLPYSLVAHGAIRTI